MIADTPARAFSKSIQGHTGAHECERCKAIGRSLDTTNDRNEGQESQEATRRIRRRIKMAFPDVSPVERTDESFRKFQDYKYHNGVSALMNIAPPINMVLMFVLDFMHLGFLGVMSRFLDYWFSA